MEKEKEKGKRAKSAHGRYGVRDQRLNAELSQEAKDGLKKQAADMHLSLNEYLERLGRGQISAESLSGEFLPS